MLHSLVALGKQGPADIYRYQFMLGVESYLGRQSGNNKHPIQARRRKHEHIAFLTLVLGCTCLSCFRKKQIHESSMHICYVWHVLQSFVKFVYQT
jgi:hypothetical protein